MDGLSKARLVCNGALTSDTPLDSSLPGVEDRRLFFKVLAMMKKLGWTVFSGDISGAYYNTPGSGYMKLPYNWPNNFGHYNPNEIVKLNCAIPDDSLSSGLFLKELGGLLQNNGYKSKINSIREKINNCFLINYSDDLLGVVIDEAAVNDLQECINAKFSVELETGLPGRWVSAEFNENANCDVVVSYVGTARNFAPKPIRFTLASLEDLILTDKVENQFTSLARSSIGKLNYLVNGNPSLGFYVSYLSSAIHYDPERAYLISESLIQAFIDHPCYLKFTPDKPTHIIVFTDASHTLKTGRDHAGYLIQLQSNDKPEPLNNLVTCGSERLAQLYSSVYAAELKAIELGIKIILKIRPKCSELFDNLPMILYNDNKAAVDTLQHKKEPHPFVTDSTDIIRELCQQHKIDVRWVSSSDNLADCLSKPKKWF